ncbi:hypothetical protein DL764_003610 [Monosporascus ibericus]|uniref:superoxide dismutase n=1 Tax=Monosporascus ibericus TaxID=155417 RepID=A0A4Q4TJ74_9PEZI|nr:hypothetical protein DL764_003610 [Monosporascus ibericus]
MHIKIISTFAFAALGAIAQHTGHLGDAEEVLNNPAGAKYVATFDRSDGCSVTGKVVATSGAGGKGVDFKLLVMNLPQSMGPFAFHLHDQPVPSDGNCTNTLGHLDPYQRGQTPPCDMEMPQTCEVGDLSGKHNKLEGPTATMRFNDKYAALVPGIGAFFGNRSIVIHASDSSRIACANFTKTMMSWPGSELGS